MPPLGLPGCSTRTRCAVLLSVFLLLACSDDPTAPPGPDEVPAVLTPTRQWAGGSVTLRWRWLENQPGLPEFRAADSVLVALRLDDTTVSLTLPRLAAGPASVAAAIDDALLPLGEVEVFGWARADPLPWLAALRPWPSPAGTEVIGIAGDGSLQVVDLATGAARGTGPLPFTGTIDEVGVSYREGLAIIHEHDHGLEPSSEWAEFWRIDPGPPEKLDSVWTGAGRNNLLELGAGRLLEHHNGDTWTSGFPAYWSDETGTGRIVPSPDWTSVIVFQGHNPLAGPNVIFMFDAVTGSPAYTLPDYRRLLHGAFTPGGTEAFLLVTAQEDPDEATRVVRIDAETGEELAWTVLPAGVRWWSVSLALAGDRVLVAYDIPALGRWHVRVLRAADLTLEVDLPMPDPATSGAWLNPVLRSTPDGSAAFLVTSTASGAWRHRVDMIPE